MKEVSPLNEYRHSTPGGSVNGASQCRDKGKISARKGCDEVWGTQVKDARIGNMWWAGRKTGKRKRLIGTSLGCTLNKRGLGCPTVITPDVEKSIIVCGEGVIRG